MEPTLPVICNDQVSTALLRLLVAAACALSCTPQGLDCRDTSVLEGHPEQPGFKGAPLGPLLVRNFPEDATTAVVTEYRPGYATKVVIVVAKPFTKMLTLTGRRCSDGTLLRFASGYPFAFNSTPVPSGVFAAAGYQPALIQPLDRLPVGIVQGAGPSYMLFTASGKWLLEVHDGDVLHGRAVLDVR
jgi:hypothetical protein